MLTELSPIKQALAHRVSLARLKEIGARRDCPEIAPGLDQAAARTDGSAAQE